MNTSPHQEILDQAWAAFEQKNYPEAERLCKSVLAEDNQNAQALLVFGHLAEASYRYPEAAQIINTSLQIDPQNAEGWVSLAKVLVDIRADDQAEAALQNALVASPGHAHAYMNLGILSVSRDDKAQAVEYFRKAIENDPDIARAYRLLAGNGGVEHGSKLHETIKARAVDSKLSDKDRYNYYYALMHVEKKAGNKADFAEALFKANAIQTKCIETHITHADIYNRSVEVYTSENFKIAERADPAPFTPIFVVGMPRSGTTLVESILGAHPDVSVGDEMEYIFHCSANVVRAATQKPFPEGFETLTKEQLNAARNEYVSRVQPLFPGAKYVTDKYPGNYHAIGFIRQMLPEAKFIALRRDPRSVGLSILQNVFNDQMAQCCDLDELASACYHYDKLIDHYETVLPGEILSVSYEELVENQEEQSRRIIAHCGLSWDDACLNFHEARENVRTLSAAQVRQPIYKGSLTPWKPYKEHLNPLLDALKGAGFKL